MYRKSIVVFIDILGFKNSVNKSITDDEEYKKIIFALEKFKRLESSDSWTTDLIETEECAQKKGLNGFQMSTKTKCTCFSDSIVISVKVEDDVNEVFSTLVSNLSMIGAELLCKGILIRGGIDLSEIHHENGIIFGPGLENFDGEDISGALIDVVGTIGSLNQAYSELKAIFNSVKNENDLEEYELTLADDEIRDDFYSHLCQFGKYIGIALESEHVYDAIGEEKLKHYKRDLKFYQELRAAVKLRYSDSIDFKEYEPKMRNIMDTYIAAEDIVNVVAPVDILDKEGFEDELSRLGSRRAKADAIRTRMTKSINAKWDENPAYYKKFSERISEIIEEYKSKRISDADYLDRMNEVREDYSKGYSGTTYPEKIKHNKNAQAFYGLIKENLESYISKQQDDGAINEDPEVYDYDNMLAEISMKVDQIIDEHVKVDWHENNDVHNAISKDLDELFFMIGKEQLPSLTFDQIDKIIEDIVVVALRRY